MELSEDGATISQLANRLTINKGNVAHHLNVLALAALVRRGPTRTVRGGTEQYFVRAAKRFRFEAPDALTAMMTNLTDELAGDQQALLNQRVLRLTGRQATALAAHLDTLVNNLEPAGDRERRYGVVVTVYQHGLNPHPQP